MTGADQVNGTCALAGTAVRPTVNPTAVTAKRMRTSRREPPHRAVRGSLLIRGFRSSRGAELYSRPRDRQGHFAPPRTTASAAPDPTCRDGPRLLPQWLSGNCGGGARPVGRTTRCCEIAGVDWFQAVAAWWVWSFSRLWVAAAKRHSERTACLPRRWNRLIPRLNFSCPNTGSTVAWRFR